MKIAFFGDSLTAGIPGASYVDRVKQALPQHTVLNHGKINDTPLSLYRRIVAKKLDTPVDMAFVFVGVNDLLIERSQLFSRIRRHWAHNDDEFRSHYLLLLNRVCAIAGHIVCISPLFIGEDFTDYWQQRLDHRADIIHDLTQNRAESIYLNIRSQFSDALGDKPVVHGIPQTLTQSVCDGLLNRSDAAITRISASRRLHYTVDGVHLNVVGAAIVASACQRAITTMALPQHSSQ